MAWLDDHYIRNLLDGREKWGTLLSLTAIGSLFMFLSEHPYTGWVNLAPILIGLYGTLFVLVADCYYEQAEAFAAAMETKAEEKASQVKNKPWSTFIWTIGFFGWLHIMAPLILGILATLVLYYGKK